MSAFDQFGNSFRQHYVHAYNREEDFVQQLRFILWELIPAAALLVGKDKTQSRHAAYHPVKIAPITDHYC